MSSVHVTTESKQDHATPHELLGLIGDRFGVRFTIDLAASEENKKCEIFFSESQDSLMQDWKEKIDTIDDPLVWADRCAWLNPPFKRAAPWMAKCGHESGKGMKIISLTLSSLGSNWYKDHVEGRAMTYVLRDRVTFEGQKDPFPKELMITLWGFGMTGLGFWSWKNG